MQIDMHYYGTYAVARIAGFPPDQARTVATAAQFVDEAVLARPVSLGGQGYLLPVVSAHEMYELAKNSNAIDQWHVWLPFHFLPGNRGGDADRRTICLWGEPDNPAAEAVLKLALADRDTPHGLHLLGVVTHVIQDTYAHYGFCGMASDLNRIDQRTLTVHNTGGIRAYLERKYRTFIGRFTGSVAEETRLGHASVATYPDRPYLHWGFEYETRPALDPGYDLENRDNRVSFHLACTRLHALYKAYLEGKPAIEAPGGHEPFDEAVDAEIREIIGTIDKGAKRCDLWQERIASGGLFPAGAKDADIEYDNDGWEFSAMEGNAGAALTHAYQFNQAARRYLNEVHTEILPGIGLLAAYAS